MRKPKPQFLTGQTVWHKTRGAGIIVERWGDWLACRECHMEIHINDREGARIRAIAHRAGGNTQPPPDLINCPHCAKRLTLIGIPGRSIYTVRFATDTTFVNACWLREPRLKAAA